MMKDNSYAAIMVRKNEIIRNSVGMDYESFEKPGIGFDYEAMMAATGYTLPELQRVQALFSVGNTPLIELRRVKDATHRIHVSPHSQGSALPPARAQGFSSRTKQPTPAAALKQGVPAQAFIRQKSLVTRALSPQPAAITAQRLHAMPQWRDLNASLFRSATTAAE